MNEHHVAFSFNGSRRGHSLGHAATPSPLIDHFDPAGGANHATDIDETINRSDCTGYDGGAGWERRQFFFGNEGFVRDAAGEAANLLIRAADRVADESALTVRQTVIR